MRTQQPLRSDRSDRDSAQFLRLSSRLSRATRWLQATREQTLARQVAIAAVAAPTGQESSRADLLTALFRRAGLDEIRRDEIGNVIATLTPPDVPAVLGRCDAPAVPPLVVMAHLDTVFPELSLPQARRDGARIYAAGIGDNGRGLSAMVALAEVLNRDRRARPSRPVEFVATVGEEGDGNLRGARHYFDARDAAARPQPRAVIALDGPGDALIVHHAIASRRLRFTYRGPGGHPWVDVHAANAIHATGRAVAALARLARTQPSGITVTVTRTGGGESLTSVPAHAWFDVDLRSLDQRHMQRLSDTVHAIAERARGESSSERSALVLDVQVLGDRPGGALDVRHPLVQAAVAATRWQGVEPQSASASSDANIPLSRGIPAIAIGAGGVGGGAHSADEWYEDVDGPRGIARALAVVLGGAESD